MIKKVISFTILLVIFLLGFQFLISFLKTNHNIIYDLEIEGEIYSIDETYKKISGRDYYLFNVSIGDSNFLFKSDNYFNKQKKVVDSIKKYSNDNVTCISLIYKNNYASAPLCIKDNNLYSYQSFVNNENFDQFLDEIPNFSSKILEDSNTTHDFYDLEIYDDYIYDDETLLIYNYKNILRVNSEIEDILTFSSYDNYKNELGMLVGKYYLVPKFTSDSDFTLYYAFNVENEVINSIIDKIKDIKFDFINEAGIIGKNTLILTDDGKLYTYSNNSNMTGVGATSDFTEIKFDGAVVEQIETLDGLSLAVLSNGEVYGWGYNTYGILGEGYELGEVYPNPMKLNLSNVRTMSLGDGFAIFGTYAGEVYGIGKNDYGQLGTGDNIGASTFVRCEELEK